jgi:6-phosphogluconolactonase (cycloisomerase 2 family)
VGRVKSKLQRGLGFHSAAAFHSNNSNLEKTMKKYSLQPRLSLFILATVAAATLVACGGGGGGTTPVTPTAAVNQLYSETNMTSNTIVRMARSATDGTLTATDTTSTGGVGTNGLTVDRTLAAADPLASVFSVITSSDGLTLFAVNAGDDSISSFSIDSSGKLTLLKRNATSGTFPNSLALSKGYLYAAFLGSSRVIAYKVSADGSLTEVDNQRLSAGGTFVPTQVKVSPDGAFLLVGGKSSAILSYPISASGTLGAAVRNATTIGAPFAGVFVGNRTYITADAASASLSSYTLNADGTLTPITQTALATGQTASCWLAITPDGKWAYVGNGNGSISLYSISASGVLALVNATAANEGLAVAGDSWISADGKYLYSTYLKDGSVISYSINATTGALTQVGTKIQVTPANGTASSPMQGLVGL